MPESCRALAIRRMFREKEFMGLDNPGLGTICQSQPGKRIKYLLPESGSDSNRQTVCVEQPFEQDGTQVAFTGIRQHHDDGLAGIFGTLHIVFGARATPERHSAKAMCVSKTVRDSGIARILAI